MRSSLADAKTQAGPLNRLPSYLASVDRGQPTGGLSSLGKSVDTLLLITAALYLAQIGFAIAVGRHLYGDGSWFLLKMLSENHVAVWNIAGWHDFFAGRIGAFTYQEYPTLLAARMGIHDLKVLSVVYGLTLFSFEPLSILICYRFVRDKRYLIFPLLALFSVGLNSEVYLVSETHLMGAFFWAALFGVLYCRRLKGLDLALLILVSAPLILCYETMALYGLVLLLACAYRFLTVAQGAYEKSVSVVFGAWYALGALFAVLAIVFPRDLQNRSDFLQSLLFVFRNDHIGARVSCIVLVLFLTVILTSPAHTRALNALVVASVSCALAIPAYILAYPARTNFGTEVIARTMNLTIPFALTVVFLAVHFRWINLDAGKYKRLFVMVAMLGIGQSCWLLIATRQWYHMVKVLRQELRSHSGPVPFDNTILSQRVHMGWPLRDLHADWPLISLSIVYADDGNVKTILLPPTGTFQPFDPRVPASLPRLSQYGVHYDAYWDALQRQAGYTLGETLTFAGNGSSAARFLGTGWSTAEDWATWSTGQDSTVLLPLQNQTVPSTVALEAQVGPHISANYPTESVEIIVNGVSVGRWSFHYVPGPQTRTIEAEVPRELLLRSNPVEIRFHLQEPPKSPAELNDAPDPRKLGLAFLKMRLYAAK